MPSVLQDSHLTILCLLHIGQLNSTYPLNTSIPQLEHFSMGYICVDLDINIMGFSVEVVKGDLTEIVVEVIVNPSNSFGFMGGGVAYTIKKKGGVVIEEEACSKAPIHVGSAVLTTGGLLKVSNVIHASTMENPSEKIGVGNVKKAVSAALSRANSHTFKTIAFPGMGTGVGGLSYDDASKAMIHSIFGFSNSNPNSSIEKIFLVAYSDELYKVFNKWLNQIQEIK